MITSPVQVYRKILLSLIDREDTHDKFVGWTSFEFDTASEFKKLCEIGLASYSLHAKKVNSSSPTRVNIDNVIANFESKFKDLLFQVELEKSNINSGHEYLICSDWSELLGYEHYVKNPVHEIYLTSTDSHYSNSSQDIKYKNYLKVSKVFDFIQFLTNQTKSDQGTIFFNRSYKFRFNLDESCLERSIDSESLESLMNKDMHREAIIHLMTKEVINFIKDQEESNRFIHIINNLNPLIHNINHSYQSYVDNYSFDKVRKEYLEKRTEYIKKMNDSFDSVATKMLAIPVGIWFAIAQIQQVNHPVNATKNVIVMITITFMVALLIMNIWGQRNTLVSMIKEYNSIFSALSSKFEDEAVKILSVKEELDHNALIVKLKMYFSISSALVLLIITLLLFIESNYRLSLVQLFN